MIILKRDIKVIKTINIRRIISTFKIRLRNLPKETLYREQRAHEGRFSIFNNL